MSTTNNKALVSAAVVVAHGLFQEACKSPGSARSGRLLFMAADVVDHTKPAETLAITYQYKPEDVSDAEFLANNLSELSAVTPDQWPNRKVRPVHWGEHTRIMRGLDEFFGSTPQSRQEASRNRAALVAFVQNHADVLSAEARTNLLQSVGADAPQEVSHA